MDCTQLLCADEDDDMLSDADDATMDATAAVVPKKKLVYDTNVSPAEHEAAVKIGKAIREKKTHLLRQLVRYLGKPACLEVLEETLRIEANGGVMRADGKGRKEPGGVYIAQIQRRISKEEMKAIRDACKPDEKRLREQALQRKLNPQQNPKGANAKGAGHDKGVKKGEGQKARKASGEIAKGRPRQGRTQQGTAGRAGAAGEGRRGRERKKVVAYDEPRTERMALVQLPRAETAEQCPDLSAAVVDYSTTLDYGLADEKGFVAKAEEDATGELGEIGEEGECY